GENKLFATLDTTRRKIVIDNLPYLLSDTVGFIRKLPHYLVECFKSTLDEVREADVLIHVVDISHPYFEDYIVAVNQTLRYLASADKPTITVFNKIDAYSEPAETTESELDVQVAQPTLMEFKNSWMAKNADPAVFISATDRMNVEEFRKILYDIVIKMHTARYPYNNLLY